MRPQRSSYTVLFFDADTREHVTTEGADLEPFDFGAQRLVVAVEWATGVIGTCCLRYCCACLYSTVRWSR